MQVLATSAAIAPLAYQAGAAAAATSNRTTATDAFGLSFESLLKIILTQLTYQDPLKPMDNFQFVSQLAQFSQIQQSQDTNDKLKALLSSQNTLQSTSLIGRVVDVSANGGAGVLSGTVTAVTFQSGDPRLTIRTPTGQTINNIAPANVTQVRGAN